MRTLKFSKVLTACANSCGIAASSDDFTNEFVEKLVGWINQRLPDGWFRHRWPEVMAVEERQFAADYSAGTAYVENDVVYYDEEYWIALQAGTGQTPAAGSAYWETTSDYDLQIAFEQAWATTEIEKFDGIFDRDPRKSRAPLRYTYRVDGDGAWLTNQAGATVWVRFWPACPEFTSDLYTEGTTYAEDDLVYSEDAGECYRAKQASTNVDPVDDTAETYWEKIHFPKFLLNWVQRVVRAEYLLDDNQDNKAAQQELQRADDDMMGTYIQEIAHQEQDYAPMRMGGYL